jgi:hypothetical protein
LLVASAKLDRPKIREITAITIGERLRVRGCKTENRRTRANLELAGIGISTPPFDTGGLS